MGYVLKWGNRTWMYALALGLGAGMALLLFWYQMAGVENFFNYYSPMLGYYVLLSICQSHYFKREPKPAFNGMFRQLFSIFGAVVIFFVNQFIMLYVFNVPGTEAFPDHLLYQGPIVMSGHFTFIVFGFFIYGFDDFMFKGKLSAWMKNDTLKAFFWYIVIWVVWGLIFYMEAGPVKAASFENWDVLHQDRILAVSQWIIIMSLMIPLVFKDYMPVFQKKLNIENDLLFGLVVLILAAAIGAAIAYFCYGLTEYIAPWGDISPADKWHHVLYMGTFPLTPVILMGVYSNNFSNIEDPFNRVVKRVMYLIPLVVLSYFAFHLIIAQPELLPNKLLGTDLPSDMGFFGEKHWYHHLDLYFNFTVSIIPLTHHWFCGRAGFVKEEEEEDVPPERPPRSHRHRNVREEEPPTQERPTGRFSASSPSGEERRGRRDLSSRQWK